MGVLALAGGVAAVFGLIVGIAILAVAFSINPLYTFGAVAWGSFWLVLLCRRVMRAARHYGRMVEESEIPGEGLPSALD